MIAFTESSNTSVIENSLCYPVSIRVYLLIAISVVL
jgi:hypothetical protein